VKGVRESIDGVSVVERLSTKHLEKKLRSIQRRAVVDVGIRLDNPDELLDRVVEVKLDLIGGRSNRLITSELNLLNQILVRVLGHLSALISIKEDIINVERSSNKRLLVGKGSSLRSVSSRKGVNSPETLTNRAKIEVNLDFVVLYEPLIPPLSGYLSAFSHMINQYLVCEN